MRYIKIILFALIAVILHNSLPYVSPYTSVLVLLPIVFLFLLTTKKRYSYPANDIKIIVGWVSVFIFGILVLLTPHSLKLVIHTIYNFVLCGIDSPNLQIKGIAPLDKTSIAEFIAYGVFLLTIASIYLRCFFIKNDKYFKIVAYSLQIIILATALLFFISSTILLSAYVYANSWTFCRICGFVYLSINFIWTSLLIKELIIKNEQPNQ